MIGNEQKTTQTTQIHHFITCAFRACGLDAATRSGVLFTRPRFAGVASSRGQLVAALPLCADVPATAAALSGHADDRRGNASGRRFYVGVIRMSLDILLARGVIDRRALNILLSSRDGQARLQSWVERAQEDDDDESEPDSVSRDTENRSSGRETHSSEAVFNRFSVIKLMLAIVFGLAILKSCNS